MFSKAKLIMATIGIRRNQHQNEPGTESESGPILESESETIPEPESESEPESEPETNTSEAESKLATDGVNQNRDYVNSWSNAIEFACSEA